MNPIARSFAICRKFVLPLLVLAGAAASSRALADGTVDGYYNVRAYGAVGDGITLDSPAIDKAISACAQAGGGTVLVPAGTYLCGSVHLQSNLHLLIDAGATILGAPQKLNAYDYTEPWAGIAYQDGGHCYFHNSLIWGENLTNVFITGNGMINGGGLVRSDDILDRMSGFLHWQDPANAETNLPPVRLGNKAICLKLCRNVVIRDVTIFHGGHFAILTTGCDNLTVDNVTMDTDRDGIDIDCCKNTMVSNCRINSPNDDGLCPKSTFALKTNILTENLTIVNCQVSGFAEGTLLDGTMKPSKGRTGRIKFGTESSGGFRNCTIANCTFRSCRGLALEEVDGGLMENITINNISMMDVEGYPLYITTGTRNRDPEITAPSRCRNIYISNIIATGVTRVSGMQITGTPEQPLENIRLSNIHLTFAGGGTKKQAAIKPKELGTGYPEPGKLGTMPAYGAFIRHAKNLELSDISVGFDKDDLRPALVCEDVSGLQIDDFKAQTAAGVAPARFESVTGLVVRHSPGLRKHWLGRWFF